MSLYRRFPDLTKYSRRVTGLVLCGRNRRNYFDYDNLLESNYYHDLHCYFMSLFTLLIK